MICHSVTFFCYYTGQSSHLYRILCFLNCVFFFPGFLPICLRLCMPENGFESAKYFQELFNFCIERHSGLVHGCRCLGTWAEKEGWWRVGLCFSDKNIDFHLIALFSVAQLPLSFSVFADLEHRIISIYVYKGSASSLRIQRECRQAL